MWYKDKPNNKKTLYDESYITTSKPAGFAQKKLEELAKKYGADITAQ